MFTGMITDVGKVVERDGGRLAIACAYAAPSIALGASIACDGCCLTVTGVRPQGSGCVFWVDVSNETQSATTLGSWQAGRPVNLERALKAGDELGGHMVTGHIDGVAEIVSVSPDGDSRRFVISAPAALVRFIASKGSVALEGTSLTVNEVEDACFGVNIIPHTLTRTTWGRKKPGDRVNLEVDVIARYAARLSEQRQ